MPDPKVTLQYSIGKAATSALARRRSALLEAAPKIDSYYEKLRKDRQVAEATVSAEVNHEALDFYNRVVTDGRFVKLLRETPEKAAEQLGLKINPEVFKTVKAITGRARVPTTVEGPVEAVIAVAVVVAVAAASPSDGIVIDQSANVHLKP